MKFLKYIEIPETLKGYLSEFSINLVPIKYNCLKFQYKIKQNYV